MTRSSRSTAALILDLENRLKEMVAELHLFGDDVSVDLAARLSQCQVERRARSHAYMSKHFQMSWPYRCRSAACWSCRRAILAKWRDRAHLRFADAGAEDCSFVTIMLACLGTLYPLHEIIIKLRRDLRNLRDAMARHHPTWNAVSLLGHIELDALDQFDIPLLGSSRQEIVGLLPVVGGIPDSMIWIPHAHLSIHHPGVCREYLAHALSEQWCGTNRVDVGEFHANRLAEDNAADCISYGLKFRESTMLGDRKIMDWPATWSAQFWSWLHGKQRGLQPIQVSLGRRASNTERLLRSENIVREGRKRLEPMPVVV